MSPTVHNIPQNPTPSASRQFKRTVNQLRELQMYKSKGQPFNPAEVGFVFSDQQIQTQEAFRFLL